MQIIKKPIVASVLGASALALSTGAMADATGAVDAIMAGVAIVGAIGGACLLVLGGAVVFKLVRRAM